MKPVQVLGCCGLISSCLSAWGGFSHSMFMIGIASLVMTAGNLYAMLRD